MHIVENRQAEEILSCLPEIIKMAVYQFKNIQKTASIHEIRMRAHGIQTIETSVGRYIISEKGVAGKSINDSLTLKEKDLSDIVFKLCSGSVYAYSEQLRQGYISRGGIRIGVCGSGVVKDGVLCGFSKYYSLNIRLPHHVKDSSSALMRLLRSEGCNAVGGILVISPPGGGKTTFLRSISACLSEGFYDGPKYCSKKVAVVDERGEIYMKDVFLKGNTDFIFSVPKAAGVEIMTRVMSPDYIVCDEIGNEKEAQTLCECASRGVKFISSCHGSSVADVMLKESIAKMVEKKIFRTACELSCENGIYKCSVKRLDSVI